MSEYLKQVYVKEEVFLNEFPVVARAASHLLGDDWKPHYWCNDRARRNKKRSLSTGELKILTFDLASVYHDKHGFSSAHIVLRSSNRVVAVHVKEINGYMTAEKIVDGVSGKD